VTDTELLAEVEDLLRTMPQAVRQATPECLAWRGRARALVEAWNASKAQEFAACSAELMTGSLANENWARMMTLLNHMRFSLQMRGRGPLTTVVEHGGVFDYFDEIRKIIVLAQTDVFFVDPYLEAEFVTRYLPHVRQGVTVRLLTRERLLQLLPALQLFAQQKQQRVEVRSGQGFHDRFVFIDKTTCYQSGASFKDGARTAPTTLTQIVDAFPAMLQTYETLWNGARVESV
jgi:hypothetical protein